MFKLTSFCLLAGLCLSATVQAKKLSLDALAQSAAWLKLLHYEQTFSGQLRSSIDSKQFFFAHNGQTDSLAELQATIEAFLLPVKKTNTHPSCLFPARKQLLDEKLSFTFPENDCPEFKQFAKQYELSGASFMLAQGYLDNASSVFGHTFFRFRLSGGDDPLLDPILNFTANTANDGGIVQMYRGMTGSYRGSYKNMTFYELMNHHNRDENRNVWEYPLNLSKQQLSLLIKHYWEIKDIQFKYYFMSHNCLTQLLAMVNAVAPGFDMLANIGFKVTPRQVLTVLNQNTDLLKPVKYHPSPSKRLRHQESLLSKKAVQTTADLLATKTTNTAAEIVTNLSQLEQARSLDLAIELSRNVGRKTAFRLARSSLDIPSNWPSTPLPEHSPTQAHGSWRTMLGLRNHNDHWRSTVGLRFIYHDMLDPSGANPWGTEVEMYNTELQQSADNSWYLRNFTFLNLIDLHRRSELLKPISSTVQIGRRQSSKKQPSNTYARFGRGLAWGSGQWITYTFGHLQLNANQALTKGWNSEFTVHTGLLFKAHERWLVQADIEYPIDLSGRNDSEIKWRIRQQWSPNQQFGWRLELGNINSINPSNTEGLISAYWYW